MSKVEMILMTKSSKYGAYCVAGFDVSDGKWIRLVSENEETQGAIDDEMLYDRRAGRCADVLDRVVVEVERAVPEAIQPENVLVCGTDRIRILERVKLEEAVRLHPFEERDALFLSHSHIVETDIKNVRHSLEFVKVSDVRIYTAPGSSGKPKYKADFECGGHVYTMFAMTDPQFYNKGEVHMERAAVALSIADSEWNRINGYYIYAARIFDLSPRRKEEVHRRRRRWLFFAGAAAAVLLLGMWLANMERVYVPQYTGARYHMTAECERLLNPQAVSQYPTVVGRLLWKACEVCGLK